MTKWLAAGTTLALALVGLSGCGKHSSQEVKEEKAEGKRLTVSAGSGRADYYTEKEPRQLIYTIRWEDGSTTTKDQHHFFYDLKGVSGELYEDGKLKSKFEADEGIADQAVGSLALDGNVKVHQATQKAAATLSCDKMTYNQDEQIVKATGGVHIDGVDFKLGNFDELWAAPDLSVASAPEYFYTKSEFPGEAVSGAVQTKPKKSATVGHNQVLSQGQPGRFKNRSNQVQN